MGNLSIEEDKLYCGGREAMSYIDRDKVSLPEGKFCYRTSRFCGFSCRTPHELTFGEKHSLNVVICQQTPRPL
jgi:hypothetical protein